jgi:hypothetical protein
MSTNSSEVYTNPAIYEVSQALDYKDIFFQDMDKAVQQLVQNSLFLYAAYEIKLAEVEKYLADPKAEVPFLKEEAALRGAKLEDMVTLVKGKGAAFKAAIRKMELLRIEFNTRYSKVTTTLDRLALRDEFSPKVRAVMEALQ